ncbi:hypothetical protein [Mesoterricola silvestris]|uniref:Uncharacterized protein n=1 Tax=Mesoterricola silvestris TaxID=2927979 RepID=A0AA48K9K2_9BACT|nr:hypothetical protein [Mesoterricola silvestris]BDU73581.1 hypothetical protein METEAL_27550 [Mesoterricola silvestris]
MSPLLKGIRVGLPFFMVLVLLVNFEKFGWRARRILGIKIALGILCLALYQAASAYLP